MAAVAGKYVLSGLGVTFCNARINRHEDAASLDVLLVILGVASFDIMVSQHSGNRPARCADGSPNCRPGRSSRGCNRTRGSQGPHTGNSESSYPQNCAHDPTTSNSCRNAAFSGTVVVAVMIAIMRGMVVRSANERNGAVGDACVAQLSYGALCLCPIVENGGNYVLCHMILLLAHRH